MPTAHVVGGCGQKNWYNLIGCSPGSGKTTYKKGGGVGGASVTMDQTCHQLIAQKLQMRQHNTMICEGVGVSRNLVFKVKKLLDDGLHLMPQLRGRQWVKILSKP